MRLLANLCYKNQVAVDTFIETPEYLGLILSHTKLDFHYPTLREWSLITIRNLCEGS